jgi:serine/threonine protein kinase/tetratricopeptide (TPR) repeat protein
MEQPGPLRFGPYVVIEQIGSGGMGAVYRARDERLQRDVAVKMLHRHLSVEAARERFLREARAVSSLNHPNICTIFDIGEQDGDPYMVMELLEGESLRDRIARDAALHQDELEAIAMQCALALAAAHGKGIIHRDIKPANLFLVANPAGDVQLKVLDFGLAKLESDRLLYGEDGGLTRTGSTVGTVEYMSPEQARGEALDPRSDLFSLGAVLYELATGDVPFRGATSAVVFAALLGSTPAPPRSQNTDVSPGMDAIVRKLLEKRLQSRVQSANELIASLRRLHAPVPNAPLAASMPKAVPQVSSTPSASKLSAIPAPASTAPPSASDGDPKARVLRITPPSGTRVTRSSDVADVVTRTELAPRKDVADRGVSGKWAIAAFVLLTLAVGGYFLYRRTGPLSTGNVLEGPMQVTTFANNTGDAVIGDAPAVAMQILLRTMPSVDAPEYAPPSAGVEVDAKALATSAGAPEYLTGEVIKDGQRYRVHAAIVRTSDGTTLASEDADASSMAELPRALSQLAMAMRTHMGETPDQANTNAVPLDVEASTSLTALNEYARGVSLRRAGIEVAAIAEFTKALAQDSNFAMARVQLAEALRESGAEVEQARAVEKLRVAAGKGSPCLRAEIAYEIADAQGALAAAQQWATACPQQTDAQVALSRSYLAEGRGADAESAASRAVSLDPHDRSAYGVLTRAAIAQDHYELALKQQIRAATMGASSPGLTALAAYLNGDAAMVTQVDAAARSSTAWNDVWNYVTYLTNKGKVDEAVHVGDVAADRLESMPAVASSAGLMRARIAAIRAMTGHCDGASQGVTTATTAAYFTALAAAWCHRPATDLSAIRDPALMAIAQGAQAWSANDAQDALDALSHVRPGSNATIAALLRGEVHLLQKQQVLAIGDYRAVITHRGAAVLTGTPVYPAAHAGLAAAYHSMGDDSNSARVHGDLQTLWADAPKSEPLLKRAAK